MNSRPIVGGEIALAFLLIGTWWFLPRKREDYEGWSDRAPRLALLLLTMALLIQLLLAWVVALYGSLQTFDDVAPRSLQKVFLGSMGVEGLLLIVGLAFAVAGKGIGRTITIGWSCVVGATFLINLIGAVNSFH